MPLEDEIIEDDIIEIISKETGIDKDRIKPDFNLRTEVDSLDNFQIIMGIEEKYEEYKIKFEDEDAEKLQTVRQIVDYIRNRPNYKPN